MVKGVSPTLPEDYKNSGEKQTESNGVTDGFPCDMRHSFSMV